MTSSTVDGVNENPWLEPGVALTLFAIGSTAVIILWLNNRTNHLVLHSSKAQAKCRRRSLSYASYKKKSSGRKATSPKNHFSHPHLLTNLKSREEDHNTSEDLSSSSSGCHSHASSEDLTEQQNEAIQCETMSPLLLPMSVSTPVCVQDHWIHESKNTPREAPSDTEDSLASSNSSGKMSRRQRKNRKRRKKPGVESYDEFPNSEFGTRFLFDRLQITEEELHSSLLPFCVDVEDRILSGYPYATDMGTFIFKPQGYSSVAAALSGHTLLEAETNDLKTGSENEYSGSDSSEEIGAPVYIGSKFPLNPQKKDYNMNFCNDQQYFANLGGSSFRTCRRCREPFCVSSNGSRPCYYHPKKPVIKKDGLLHYQCCIKQKENVGCTVTQYHVYYQLYSGLNGPLPGYVSTKNKPRGGRVIAMDCEMVYTSEGFEVAKVTLVNPMGKVLLDTYVKPIGTVYDYNTQFSGIKSGDLVNAITFIEVQERLLSLISRTDILVGHSLEGDLCVLKLIHRRVLDTSLLFKQGANVRDSRGGSPIIHRQALKTLVKKHLGKEIQRDSSGHSSLEDAAFALNLALWHLWERRPQVSRSQKVAPLPLVLQALS